MTVLLLKVLLWLNESHFLHRLRGVDAISFSALVGWERWTVRLAKEGRSEAGMENTTDVAGVNAQTDGSWFGKLDPSISVRQENLTFAERGLLPLRGLLVRE